MFIPKSFKFLHKHHNYFIDGEFIGIELYANTDTWKSMSTDILKTFSIEALRFKDRPAKNGIIEYNDELIKILGKIDLQFSSRKGIDLGNVVEFTSNGNKLRGITLVLDSITV